MTRRAVYVVRTEELRTYITVSLETARRSAALDTELSGVDTNLGEPESEGVKRTE